MELFFYHKERDNLSKSKMLKVNSPTQNDLINVALYARVSTDAQAEEGYSIDIQKEKLLNYAKTLSATPDNIEYYIDDGYSGGNLNRPRMNDLIQDIERGTITHVIVYKLDRLSRSQKDTLYLIEDVFIPHNVAFISVQESFNTSTPFGRAVIGILSVFAQLERENIYERTRSGMRKRVEAGYWMGGGVVPFGYDYDSTKGILVPNENADIVKQIYKLYIEGHSEYMLAEKFGLKYDRLVHQILTRKSNTGIIVYNGEEYQGLHEPLVDMETYNTAMQVMKNRSQKRLVSKTSYLLTGLLECGICGAKMRYQTWGKGKVKIVCYSKQSSKKYLIKDPNCSSHPIDCKEIEEIVLKDMFRMTGNLNVSEDAPYNQTVIETLISQERVINRKIQKLYELYATDEDNEHLLTVIEDLRKEHKSVKQKIEKERDDESQYKASLKASKELNNLEDIWEYMTHEERVSATRSLVEKITINKDEITVNYKI